MAFCTPTAVIKHCAHQTQRVYMHSSISGSVQSTTETIGSASLRDNAFISGAASWPAGPHAVCLSLSLVHPPILNARCEDNSMIPAVSELALIQAEML